VPAQEISILLARKCLRVFVLACLVGMWLRVVTDIQTGPSDELLIQCLFAFCFFHRPLQPNGSRSQTGLTVQFTVA